jgi:hypothetical protein
MGDFYYFIDNNNPELKDKRGFWFRRIYFTYDYKIDEKFSSRIRLEMSNSGKFSSSDKIIPFVKDAWLKYKFSNQALILGISPTPSFQLIEKIWGYRSVEKTPLDLQRMASSRDFGLAAKGQFDEKGMVKYHAMFSNGSSNKEEIDKGKSGMLALAFFASKEIVLEVYGDYADKEGETDWYTLQGFLGYKGKKVKAGIQYSRQTRMEKDTTDIQLRVASVFITGDVTEKISLLARLDKRLDPNSEGSKIPFIPFDPAAKSLLLILGLDWHPVSMVKLIPNVEFVSYSENSAGVTPTDDIIARITFFWAFK